MKHVNLVSRKPALAQQSTLEIKIDFLGTLVTQIITWIFQSSNGGAV